MNTKYVYLFLLTSGFLIRMTLDLIYRHFAKPFISVYLVNTFATENPKQYRLFELTMFIQIYACLKLYLSRPFKVTLFLIDLKPYLSYRLNGSEIYRGIL